MSEFKEQLFCSRCRKFQESKTEAEIVTHGVHFLKTEIVKVKFKVNVDGVIIETLTHEDLGMKDNVRRPINDETLTGIQKDIKLKPHKTLCHKCKTPMVWAMNLTKFVLIEVRE